MPDHQKIQPLVISHTGNHDAVINIAKQISPHIDRLCRDHGHDLDALLAGKAEDIIQTAEKELSDSFNTVTQEDEIKKAIRTFRMRVNHAVVITDLLDLASVDQHLKWLSNAARTAVSGTARWVTGQSNIKGLTDGWFILALGKLGADELNYSSDIDLIVITSPDMADHHSEYIKLTRRLTQILSQPTADGIGWRVDLRLRPDPGATPIAINRDAAISYYESLARTWERAAFIRAIPVGGNIKAGENFLSEIRPFLWRRYLDYTVLEDMRVMLRREPRSADLLGFNIKNGQGGIRSIEFFIHVQQLIAAGREKGLRQRQTRNALKALAEGNWITNDDRDALSDAYLYLRRLEHRLQMIGDSQTHQLPKSEEQMEALACFCGHPDSDSLRQAIIRLGDDVHRRTAPLMARIGGISNDAVISNWLEGQDENTAPLIDHLKEMGYDNVQGMVQTMQGWMAGRIPATRSERTRNVMARLLPKLIQLFAEGDQPDTSFSQFSRLMDAMPSGLQLLSLLESNTELATTITTIIASAPELGEQLARHPVVVDSLMYGEFWNADINWEARRAELDQALARGRDYEDQLDILRRIAREWKFNTALHLLTGVINSNQAGQAFSQIAEILINAILPHVTNQMTERYGHVTGGGLVVLALGRLGVREMTYKSDLDLIFIYDAADDLVSEGQRGIAASVWYARLGQQLINALTALTSEGMCYSVDMRLRPSGNTGPVAIHIDGFEQYQMNDAWVWEHMALLKARVIGGLRHEQIGNNVQSIIKKAITKNRTPEVIIGEVAEMRQRLKKHFPTQGPSDLRHREGGLMDLDFVIQSLQLMPDASHLPECQKVTDAIPMLEQAGMITKSLANDLLQSAEQLNALQHWMRLTMPEQRHASDPDTLLPKPFQESFSILTIADLNKAADRITAPVRKAMDALLDGKSIPLQ